MMGTQGVKVAHLSSDHDSFAVARLCVAAVEGLLADATLEVGGAVMKGGRIDGAAFDDAQRATHGLAWLATYAQAMRQLVAYAERLRETDLFTELEELILRIGIGEY